MPSQSQGRKRIFSADKKGLTALIVELCKRHLRRFPTDAVIWLCYGIALVELARYSDAEKAFRRSIALRPKERVHWGFAQMGHLFEAKGDFNKAAFWHRRAQSLVPKDATYHVFRGHIAFKRGLLKRAEFHYRSAIKCPEGCIDEAYFNLGGVLLASGRYAEAIDCYRKAIEIDPKYRIAKKRLKDAQLALQLTTS